MLVRLARGCIRKKSCRQSGSPGNRVGGPPAVVSSWLIDCVYTFGLRRGRMRATCGESSWTAAAMTPLPALAYARACAPRGPPRRSGRPTPAAFTGEGRCRRVCEAASALSAHAHPLAPLAGQAGLLLDGRFKGASARRCRLCHHWTLGRRERRPTLEAATQTRRLHGHGPS
jgi:hypothetical protein